MSDHRFTFSKMERLSSRKEIALLFEKGYSFYSHPFSVVWRVVDPLPLFPARVAISVPKKNLKKAVDRNRVKRVFRESWRHNKATLYDRLEQQKLRVVIMLIYTGRELPSQVYMNSVIEKLIAKFSLVLEEPLPEKELNN